MTMSSAVKKYPKYYYKHPLSRVSGKNPPIETQRVYPVLTAEQMLKQRGRRRVMDEVRMSCGAPIEYFNALYKQLIENYAEFIQNLPVANNFRLCRFDKQLHLASLALSLREPYLLAGELLKRTVDREKALWNYVMFSGVLLSRLGQLVTMYQVSICDEKGVYVKNWEPLSAYMKDQGSHYKIRDIEINKTLIDSQLNFAIARQIMPEDGFNWIASHPMAFEQWIMALDSTGEAGAGTLTARFFVQLESWLSKEHKMQEEEAGDVFEEYLEELLDAQMLEEEEQLDHEEVHGNEPRETLVGEQFYQWMRKGIQDNRLKINDRESNIFMTKQGALLLHPEVFERFIKENPTVKTNVNEVFNQFSKIGLVANANLENYVAKFPGLREQHVKGVLLKDVSSLIGRNEPPPLTPYVLEGIAMGRRTTQVIGQRVTFAEHFKEAKEKAHNAELQAKETEKERMPKISKEDKPSYKENTLTNKPPMKR